MLGVEWMHGYEEGRIWFHLGIRPRKPFTRIAKIGSKKERAWGRYDGWLYEKQRTSGAGAFARVTRESRRA